MNQANYVEGDKRTERTGELRGWENRENREDRRTERMGELRKLREHRGQEN